MPWKIGPVGPVSAAKLRLKVRQSGGTCLDPLPTSTPPQKGPNCGFYALAYVLSYWHQKGAVKDAPLPARKVDTKAVKAVDKPGSLRELARGIAGPSGSPISYVGELFSADAMAKVAQAAGFRAVVHKPGNSGYLEQVRKLLDRGIPPIVGVDVDADATLANGGLSPAKNANHGCPGEFDGDHAHWITLVGYAGGDLYQMNWGSYYEFAADSLRKSTNQLTRFKTPGSRVWTKTVLSDGTKVGERGERWRTDHVTPDPLRGISEQKLEEVIKWPELWYDQKAGKHKTKKEYLGFTTAELVELKKDRAFLKSDHKILLGVVGGERSAAFGNLAKGYYGYANKFTTELSGGTTTLTTVFPEVLLDLSNQVVEVTPPGFDG